MDFRTVGGSGLKVSTLGLGCNNLGGRLDEAASARVVHAALDHGVTLFDTADIYPMETGELSEQFLGKALGQRRPEIVLATKFGHDVGASRSAIVTSVEASLKRLGTDWIDLFQLHRPDATTPVDETLRALDDLIRAGKVRYVGSSQFSAWQVVEAEFVARELGANRFVSTQTEYSLVAREAERDILPVCAKYGVGLIPFFPLASGILTGKYKAGASAPKGTRLDTSARLAGIYLTPENLAVVEKLEPVAQALGAEMIDLAFAYLLASPAVPSVIAGASTPEQLARNAKAVEFALSGDGLAAIRAALA